jgi:hypothetical protein
MNTVIPKESGKKRPLSSSQSSGKTKFERMTTGSKVGGTGKPSGMPKH